MPQLNRGPKRKSLSARRAADFWSFITRWLDRFELKPADLLVKGSGFANRKSQWLRDVKRKGGKRMSPDVTGELVVRLVVAIDRARGPSPLTDEERADLQNALGLWIDRTKALQVTPVRDATVEALAHNVWRWTYPAVLQFVARSRHQKASDAFHSSLLAYFDRSVERIAEHFKDRATNDRREYRDRRNRFYAPLRKMFPDLKFDKGE